MFTADEARKLTDERVRMEEEKKIAKRLARKTRKSRDKKKIGARTLKLLKEILKEIEAVAKNSTSRYKCFTCREKNNLGDRREYYTYERAMKILRAKPYGYEIKYLSENHGPTDYRLGSLYGWTLHKWTVSW